MSRAFVTSVTGEFPAQTASNAENVSIWWRHHAIFLHWNCIQYIPWNMHPVVCCFAKLWWTYQFFMESNKPLTRIRGTFPLMRSGSGAVAAGSERIFGFRCFHVVCFHYGGAVAVRWRCGDGCSRWIRRMGPGAIFRSALRSGSGLETIGINSLEVSKPLYWYWKYPDRSVIWQENLLLCCCSICEISKRLESLKYQSPGFRISRNVRIRHFNSLLNRFSTSRVAMLM